MNIKELCAKNIADEAEAIEGYYPLLDELEAAGDKDGVEIVKGIIAEESKHLNLLQVIMYHHNGGLPIEKDDLGDTFDFLKKITK